MNIFCCTMNSTTVTKGSRLKFHPKNGKWNGKRNKLIGSRQVVDPQKRGGPQIDRVVQSAIKPDKDRQLEHHRQTAGEGVVAGVAEQIHLGLGEFLLVVAVLLFEFLQLRLQFLHPGGALGLFSGQRKQVPPAP